MMDQQDRVRVLALVALSVALSTAFAAAGIVRGLLAAAI
jgi:hypothetical protein